MRSIKSFMIFSLALFIPIWVVCTRENPKDQSDSTALYLGQKPPGMTPVIFAPGILSHPGKSSIGIGILQGGKEFYYTQWGKPFPKIMCMKTENGNVVEDTTAPFSGKYMDWDFTVAPDGKRLYFSSKRPLTKGGEAREDADIWFVEKIAETWSEPKNAGFPINSDKNEVHPTIAKSGNIYFFGKDGPDIYVSKYENGRYLDSEKLGDEINSEFVDIDPFVAPDESYLIFNSNRPGGFGNNDLFISFRNKEGTTWTQAINMGTIINTENSEYCARVSLDGKYLFFSRRMPDAKNADFYWVDSKIIDKLKSEKLKE